MLMKTIYISRQKAIVLAASLVCLLFMNSGLNSDHPIDGYKLSLAFPALEFDMPVELTSPNDNTDRIFVVEQKGKIISFPNKADVKNPSVFLDIVKKVDSGGEKGLLGLAF